MGEDLWFIHFRILEILSFAFSLLQARDIIDKLPLVTSLWYKTFFFNFTFSWAF